MPDLGAQPEGRAPGSARLARLAARQGANGVINIEFELSSMGNTLVIVNGTAVRIRPVQGYVPEGATGNLLAEIADTLAKREG